jgi:hypothetical protein
MAPFREKPVLVQAIQYTGTNNPFCALQHHTCTNPRCFICGPDNLEPVAMLSNYGARNIARVDPGDWVVKYSDGELRVVASDTFLQDYEPHHETPAQ